MSIKNHEVKVAVLPVPRSGLENLIFLESEAVVDQWLSVKAVANLVMEYLFTPERFGKKEWLHWFGCDVGEEPKFLREIFLFWNQPDPIDPTKKVSETHLPPVLCPEFINGQPFTLRLLGQLVQHPQNGGNVSKYSYQTEPLKQHQDAPAGPACWLVMRKGVGARGEPYAAQVAWIQSLNASYEARTRAIHLATVVFTRHVFPEAERHLGNGSGQEGRSSYGRCQEFVQYGTRRYPLLVGGFAPSGLCVNYSGDGFDDDSVVALRKV